MRYILESLNDVVCEFVAWNTPCPLVSGDSQTSCLVPIAEMEAEAETTAEVEMRAAEDIEMGRDLAPPLCPLAFSLYDSFLSSHCSSCFSPLPPSTFSSTATPPPSPPSPLYCSAACSFSDNAVQLPQLPPDAFAPLQLSDIRAALGLLSSTTITSSAAFPHRIGNLLTNSCRIMADRSVSTAIRRGAAAIAAARRVRKNVSDPNGLVLEEAALCSVITNAVELHDKTGCALGIAVYDAPFSWINHSCSPNACYRPVISSPATALLPEDPRRLRIVPHMMKKENHQGDIDFSSKIESPQGRNKGYGPRMIVRSIKRIRKGEEITVSYTDLLQPKAPRQSDLCSKYQFTCCCRRCDASTPSYVDSALEGVYLSKLESIPVDFDDTAYKEEASRRITDYIDEAIDDFLSNGDPVTCCKNIEDMLNDGLSVEQSQAKEGKLRLDFRLNPLHHTALNAYTTLASAYKICSSDLIFLNSENELKAFGMSRTGAAYSLFLAGATHHLFSLESSLIVSAANFWTSAGESLIELAQNRAWDAFSKRAFPISGLPSLSQFKCTTCSLTDTFEASGDLEDLEGISNEFLGCLTDIITRGAWSFLVRDCDYLRKFRNPIDFRWMEKDSDESGLKIGSRGEFAQGYSDKERAGIFELGFHCLLYGGLLANICYGSNSHLAS